MVVLLVVVLVVLVLMVVVLVVLVVLVLLLVLVLVLVVMEVLVVVLVVLVVVVLLPVVMWQCGDAVRRGSSHAHKFTSLVCLDSPVRCTLSGRQNWRSLKGSFVVAL